MPREAKIKKRADGFYQRSISIGRKPDGTPIRKTIYAKTLKELEKKSAEFERQLAHGTLSSNEKMTFGELADIWIKDYKPSISITTKAMYQSELSKHLLPELSSYKLRDLKAYHLQSIINRMAENGKAESTMKKVKLTAEQIMKVALDNDVIYRNVFEAVKIPAKTPNKRRPLNEDEQRLVTNNFSGHRMGLSALLLLYCGLRRGELIALTWNDIDVKNKALTVNKAVVFSSNQAILQKPKTDAGTRTIPIPEVIINTVRMARKDAQSAMVCPAIDGSMMSQTAFNNAWKSFLHYLNIKAGGRDASRSIPKLSVVDNLTPHMFRHTYATILYNAGVDLKSAQRFLGHADINVTLKIYTHLSAQKEQEAVAALNSHLMIKEI